MKLTIWISLTQDSDLYMMEMVLLSFVDDSSLMNCVDGNNVVFVH